MTNEKTKTENAVDRTFIIFRLDSVLTGKMIKRWFFINKKRIRGTRNEDGKRNYR